MKMSDLEYHEDELRESTFPLDSLNSKEQQRLPEEDSLCMEMVEFATNSERDEGSDPLEENANEMITCFIKGFPAQKEEIEKCIGCIREVADKIDKIHKDCTIATITASSAGATSGILTIVGLALAPVTAGVSLILTGTGLGLGVAAATTGISANICERVMNSKEREKAEELLTKCEETLNKCQENIKATMNLDQVDFSSGFPTGNKANEENVQHFLSNATHPVPNPFDTVKEIIGNVGANPNLKASIKQVFSAAGQTFPASRKGPQMGRKSFRGNALAINNMSRIVGIASAVAALLGSIYCIVQDAIHIKNGAKAEMTAEIRQKACNLEETLKNLNNLYDEVKCIM
ncbi:apolipoprotein L6 [Anolis carolinensis]|uniref:Apolipoprotein L3 n=1 Tax=Anolis carolinensis TaxID=28377 RepID=A0A803U182_ANOCA|nr:PREDICTED: apolipoprotein L6 [Anolis carolinensis]|eukprot:XP_008108844.1 PREDICTED: apolipoprotein L6 [Anolis carolinensis]